MKIISITYNIPGIDSHFLTKLESPETIEFLSSFFAYKSSIELNIKVYKPVKDFDSLVLTKEIKNLTSGKIFSQFNEKYDNHTIFSYMLSGSSVDFQRIIDLKNVHKNMGKLVMSLKSDNYYESCVANIVYNLLDYIDEN